MKNYNFVLVIVILAFLTIIGACYYFFGYHNSIYENYQSALKQTHFLENIRKKSAICQNHIKNVYIGLSKDNIKSEVEDLKSLRDNFKKTYINEFSEVSKDFDALIDVLQEIVDSKQLNISDIREINVFFGKFNTKLNHIYSNSQKTTEITNDKFNKNIKAQIYLIISIVAFIFVLIILSVIITKIHQQNQAKKIDDEIQEIYELLSIEIIRGLSPSKHLKNLSEEIQKQIKKKKSTAKHLNEYLEQMQSGKMQEFPADFDYDLIMNKTLENLQQSTQEIVNLIGDDLEDITKCLDALASDNYFVKTKKIQSKAEKSIEKIRNKLISLSIDANEELNEQRTNQNINYDIN